MPHRQITHIAPKENYNLTHSLCGLKYKFKEPENCDEGMEIVFSFAVVNFHSVNTHKKDVFCKSCMKIFKSLTSSKP